MTEYDHGPKAFTQLTEEHQLTVAERKTRHILETHAQPRVGWLLNRPDDGQPVPACPHTTGMYVVDWMCEGVGLLCPDCSAEHYVEEGPHLHPRHRCCIVCGVTSGLAPLTATVRMIRQVRTSGGRLVVGLLGTTPIVWECRLHDGFLDTEIELRFEGAVGMSGQ